MARASNNKIKIGVHWKNTVSIDITSPNSPRHPKLIELDPVCLYENSLLFYSNFHFRTFHSMIILQKFVKSKENIFIHMLIYFSPVGKFLNQI